jgi:1-acyl-sn-glycerol-3-phosphate acyltransferase
MILIYASDRPISFIIAAKSYRKPFLGLLSRAIGAIPVERP